MMQAVIDAELQAALTRSDTNRELAQILTRIMHWAEALRRGAIPEDDYFDAAHEGLAVLAKTQAQP